MRKETFITVLPVTAFEDSIYCLHIFHSEKNYSIIAGPQVTTTMTASNNALLFLTPLNGTFEEKVLLVPLYPDLIKISRQINVKAIPLPANGYFDSKVLSRQHAEVWADHNGKIWIRDTKSSNGTFVNGQRLSVEHMESDPHELREQDVLELGVDVVGEDQTIVVHHKVAARVEYAGPVKTQLGDEGLMDYNVPGKLSKI